MAAFESEAVLLRIASYINGFCSCQPCANVKVSKIFGNDVEAWQLLSKMLSVDYIRTNILEGLCDCRFQGIGQRRELCVRPSSKITDQQIELIKSKLNCGSSKNVYLQTFTYLKIRQEL